MPLRSDAEGVGAVQIVRYDPARGADVELHLSTGVYAPLRTTVRDGGVDLSTVCELPPGCEHREYGEAPMREYRWTPRGGLRARRRRGATSPDPRAHRRRRCPRSSLM